MSITTKEDHIVRSATLRLSHAADVPVLTARVPANLSREEFAHVAAGAFDLISKMTAHPCMSGKIKFSVEEDFLNEITNVNLRTGQLT